MYPKELPTTTRYTLYLYWAANLSFFSSSFFTLSQREALGLNLLQSALNVFAPFAHVTDATPPPRHPATNFNLQRTCADHTVYGADGAGGRKTTSLRRSRNMMGYL